MSVVFEEELLQQPINLRNRTDAECQKPLTHHFFRKGSRAFLFSMTGPAYAESWAVQVHTIEIAILRNKIAVPCLCDFLHTNH